MKYTIIHATLSLSMVSHLIVAADLSDPYTVPVHAASCLIQKMVSVPAPITARESGDVRALFYGSIDSFKVSIGDKVTKGQLIATSASENNNQMKRIYADYVELYRGQVGVAKHNLEIVSQRRTRLKGLLDKGIIPQSEFDESEKATVIAKDTVDKLQRGMDSMQKNVDLYDDQIKAANFYAPISGIISQMIVDPRAMTGTVSVSQGSLIAKVDVPGSYRASAEMLDVQVAQIQPKMAANIIFPDGKIFPGVVTYISVLPNSKKQESNSYGSYQDFNSGQDKSTGSGPSIYNVQVDFEVPGPLVVGGLTAVVRLVTQSRHAEQCLPWNAITVQHGKPSIRLFEEKIGWKNIAVQLGGSNQRFVEILSPKLQPSAIIESRLW
jgi:multidrug efflux pump subunit AcrA (membrane-fusion protein)